jgi:NADH:ubiquinone oxidoreductase subunit F (NADH-binding)
MDLVDLLESAGLTGRGGAAFSTATKLRAAREQRADLVVNACDGELGATKDAWVVAHHLDELVKGAELIAPGSRRPVRYAAHRGSTTLAALRAHGLEVLDVPARYVSSEESALVSLAHGGLARPLTKEVPVVRGGRDSRGRATRATLVLNAETVWRVAQVATYGAPWFRSFGTHAEPGPRLVSVHGYVARPGVVETAAGASMSSLVDAVGGLAPEVESALVGGLAGVFLTADELSSAAWTTASLSAFGGGLGSGVVEVLDPRPCPLDRLVAMLRYAAGESAGQCGPCMYGLPAVADDVARLVAHPDRATYERLQGRLGLLPGRGACRFPDGVSRFTGSALRVYAGHLEEHLAGRNLHAVPA